MSFIFIPMSVAKFFEAECYVNELLLILRFSAAKMLTLFPSEALALWVYLRSTITIQQSKHRCILSY